ncbi:MAG: pilus assembly PilX N-terminal domain-containing protein [Desulfobacteraceae bacterium]|nr:pilus assembly PilX N-terminal domain-containing protein [Desulfobacteraceae bacterium]
MKKQTDTQRHLFVLEILADKKGSVLLTTMIVLLLLTLIGVSGINTSSTDLQITRNYRIYNENLMLADAAVNRAVTNIAFAVDQNIVGRSWVDDLLDGTYLVENIDPKYIKNSSSYDPFSDPVTNRINVGAVLADWNNIFTPVQLLSSEPDTEYVAFLQLEAGASPDERDSSAVIIARSSKSGGNFVLEAGFRNDRD